MVMRGEPIVGGGAGTGLSPMRGSGRHRLIVIYNSGRYRMPGAAHSQD